MNKSKFRFSNLKIWHFIVLTCGILFFINLNIVINSYILIFKSFPFIFSNYSVFINQIDLPFIDIIFSSLLVIFIPIFILFKRKRYKIFYAKMNFTFAILVLLITIFVFAPLVSTTNPDFYKNIGVTKLLPPFSSVKEIQLKDEDSFNENSVEQFFEIKNKIVKNSFDESIIYADSIRYSGSSLIYFQKGELNKIELENLKTSRRESVGNKYFILGTDEYGRDIYSRLIYGARISLLVGIGSVIISFIIGVTLGFLAGYPGGFIDSILSRFTDIFLSFPLIFLIILILAFFGNSLLIVIIVLGFSGWMSLFKIVRGEIIGIKHKDYFITAKLIGLKSKDILIKEALPVIIVPVFVNLIFLYGNVILAEAALSFLGLGTGGIYPSWGAMISAGQNYMSDAWWMIFFPGLFLVLTLYTANNLGKRLNQYLNPRLKYD